MTTSRLPTTVDASIGKHVRARRLLLGISGRQLAEIIGVTTQQVHKYETGVDRISAGLLYVVAEALDTPISYFFGRLSAKQVPVGQRQRMLMEFTHNFGEIQNENHQKAIGNVIRLLGPSRMLPRERPARPR
jgi:transcriptional regulator with XRE-family HTH domain